MKPPDWIDIKYDDFWDVPRRFIFVYEGISFRFDCPFSDALDEYPDFYQVYRVALASDSSEPESVEFLGTIQIQEVEFDSTRRRQTRSDVFKNLKPA